MNTTTEFNFHDMSHTCYICSESIEDNGLGTFFSVCVEQEHKDFSHIDKRNCDDLEKKGLLNSFAMISSIHVFVCRNCASTQKEADYISEQKYSLFEKL